MLLAHTTGNQHRLHEPTAAINALLAACATATVADDVCNQYADNGTASNAIRRANLARYLHQVLALGPTLLLIGEAPGYLGCRRTGVPFTSEQLLLAGVNPPGLFGAAHGFQLAEEALRQSSEQTATIVWREMKRHKLVPLSWNAWPFHPYRAGNPATNRTPRVSELTYGQTFLRVLLAFAPDLPLVAMGNSAARSLTALGLPHYKVRHPAQGGARIFADGIQRLVDEEIFALGSGGTMMPDTHHEQ